MKFISLPFFVFFVVVYGLYLLCNHRRQNRLLLVASYVFYGSWDWRFLVLIFASTVFNYFCGWKIDASANAKEKRAFLWLCVLANLTVLFFFKYYHFFIDGLSDLSSLAGITLPMRFLEVVLPVGLSYYTFQAMSYSMDIYLRGLKPVRNFFDFSLFVSFFPNLLSGPIETARHFLPQILSPRIVTLEKFYEGCYLIFWGIFQKAFVADNLLKIITPFFNSAAPYNGTQVLFSLYAVAIQVFCDFSGYTDIARGLGKCMGFDLKLNFRLPYFVTNIADFWKRWHMSFYGWLKDYVYMPLVFRAKEKTEFVIYRSMFIIMVLAGLWHGSSVRFLLWGIYNGLLVVGYRLLQPALRKIPLPRKPLLRDVWFVIRVILFFHLVCFGIILFKTKSVAQALQMLQALFLNFSFDLSSAMMLYKVAFFCLPLLAIQLLQFSKDDLLAVLKINPWLRGLIYFYLFHLMMVFAFTGGNQFIYFQF